MNGLARIDAAIGQLKKATRRMQEIRGGTWYTHLAHVTNAFNKTRHGAIDSAPNNLPNSVILE